MRQDIQNNAVRFVVFRSKFKASPVYNRGEGGHRESNSGPPAPEAGIIPLDHAPKEDIRIVSEPKTKGQDSAELDFAVSTQFSRPAPTALTVATSGSA